MSTYALRNAYTLIVVNRLPDLHKRITAQKGTIEHSQLTYAQHTMRLDSREFMRLLSTYSSPDNFFEKRKTSQTLTRFYRTYEGIYMPKKPTNTRSTERPEWKGFLERRLSDAELDAFDNEVTTDEDILAATVELTYAGYDVKLSYSGRLQAYTCTLVDQDGSRKTAGYALSAQDTTGREALRMALYKHFVVLNQDWNILLGGSPTIRRG